MFWGGGGADLGEVVADTQPAMQWAVTKAPWSIKLTQAKCGMFLRGYRFSPAQAKIYMPEWILS